MDLFYIDEDVVSADLPNSIPVGEVSLGEIFSTCALIEPHAHSATARVALDSRLLLIQANALQALLGKDASLAYHLNKQAAQMIRARLETTRILIAAAWAGSALPA